MDTEGKLLKVEEAAKILNVSVRTVWRMIADKELTAIHVRGCTRIALAKVLGGSQRSQEGVPA